MKADDDPKDVKAAAVSLSNGDMRKRWRKEIKIVIVEFASCVVRVVTRSSVDESDHLKVQ